MTAETTGQKTQASGSQASGSGEPGNLDDLLDRLGEAGRNDQDGKVSVDDIWHTIGQRSFGPLLLVAGLVVMTPLGGIPSVPTIFGVIVILIAGQLLLGRESFWLPGFLRRLRTDQGKLDKSIRVSRPVARFVDRLIKPRLTWLTRSPWNRVIAGVSVALAAIMPPLELVPMGAAVPAAAITAFGLALVAHDGVLALIAFAISLGGFVLVGTQLL
ncbi:exopolysaccharide biosynthesis protein [Tistrella mobilis]|uniref:Exopolysaccharide synthesis protein n=1 Tax=Tistrella mobilis (strain KA081020-065) TaxID=1110502 RepID=I3TRR7_TISMK|nr:exopolysaccharide biosynthesis protein [Tistrella mobilis]AFK55455.1 putative exopolysaccharide synthesis protein [Tistrella mobilis KA081020-065]